MVHARRESALSPVSDYQVHRRLFHPIRFALLLGFALSKAAAAESTSLDPEGYIRDWIMLAPIALPEGRPAADLILRDQIVNESALKPRDGDSLTVNGQKLIWQRITAPTNYFDFNALLKTQNDRAAGFMAAYIECDEEIPDVIMSVGSNDQGRIYFNGVDIYAFTEARPLSLYADKGRVTLKKGVNVILFKIINEQNAWQGALRLTDKSGKPLKNLKIRSSP
ncbi:MAG TPA: hypothetical protein PLX89_12395 [Verrucomicrobiota bacterium]|nr:hypothetical protein [Verrucomicrobiales bacterium]HRI13792.1 hypothetical protein [Verrucomicrobiota bacterium]